MRVSLMVTGTGTDLFLLTLDAERTIEPLIVTEFSERNAELSPDGTWLAYESNASGQYEIYVQPFPDVEAGRWQVFPTGGTRPLWGPDGRELFYRTQTGVMGVTVETVADFETGTPELIVEQRSYYGGDLVSASGRTYDVSPDGEKFLMIKDAASDPGDDPFAGLTQIRVVQNWFEELQARVPTDG